MKTFINHAKVNRRARLSNIMSMGGLALLLISVLVPLFLPALANVSYVLMFAGLGVAMIGIYFANRWVRKPRPEESLAKALKSLDDQYHLYHYSSLPCDHLLLTPTGLVLLEVINLAGDFSYKDGRWKEAMSIGRALRYIVEERVSNPILAAQQVGDELRKHFSKEFDSSSSIPIRAVVVFTHPLVQLALDNAPVEICKVDKLKKHITSKATRLTPDLYASMDSYLEKQTM